MASPLYDLCRWMECPVCGDAIHDVYQLLDPSHEAYTMTCPSCGQLQADRSGAICQILGVSVSRPHSVGVREWNRSVREVEKTVIANHEAAVALLKRCKP